ncbi:MAG: D-alanyl-lipoteichoic acid biosynthesis protein DltB [Peptococcaceae bacterium]|nr:D-alanyl-lipoteichoic acid biosynthesis protein DltB [Peptococcaceae bacterium]
MIPYGSFYFFYLLFLSLIPAFILGILEKPIRYYGLLASLAVLSLLFSGSKVQAISLVAFYFGELLLVKTYSLLRKKWESRWLLRIYIIFSLLPLAFVKWGHYFSARTFGFLGISYLTFKAIQMLLEIGDGLIKEVSFFEFTYFLLFFPTISSGPIDRSRRFGKDILEKIPRNEYLERVHQGLKKIAIGAGYKFVISSAIFNYWLAKIPLQQGILKNGILSVFSYMYGYSFYLFFDFAGYSLMAIGVSYILGVNTPDNFNKPFISKDIKDFWNRWHMSLSFWFRDYIYTRFVMSSMKKKRFKGRFTASYVGYMITMTTMGIWHGTEIYYILYGIYHGILIVLTDFFQRHSKLYKQYKNKRIWNISSTFITFQLICFGFLIFSGKLFNY